MRLQALGRRAPADRRVQATSARPLSTPIPAGRSLLDPRPQPGRRPAVRTAFQIPWGRLVGATGLVAATSLLFWLTSDPMFVVNAGSVPVEGARYASPDEVRARLGLVADRDPNLFLVATGDM